jgi:uncharacterized protein YggE
MRRLFYFVALSMFTVGFSGHADAQDTRQISVVGTGTVTAKPDILRIMVGVVAHDPEAGEAMRQMGDDLTKVMAALSDEGVPPADIQTTGLRLSERYNENRNYDEPPKVVGFTATSSVNVVVRDMDRAGGILDRLVSEGANQISGLQFDIEDRVPLLEQARVAAIGDAITKTALYADAARVKVGAILSISEMSGGGGFDRGQVMAMAESRSVPIAAGTLDVTAQITVVTAIE